MNATLTDAVFTETYAYWADALNIMVVRRQYLKLRQVTRPLDGLTRKQTWKLLDGVMYGVTLTFDASGDADCDALVAAGYFTRTVSPKGTRTYYAPAVLHKEIAWPIDLKR
jgi:hypothetical protein